MPPVGFPAPGMTEQQMAFTRLRVACIDLGNVLARDFERVIARFKSMIGATG